MKRTPITVVVALGVLVASLSGCDGDNHPSPLGEGTGRPGGGEAGRAVVVGCKRAVYGPLGGNWRSPGQGTVVAGPIAWVGLFGYAREQPPWTYQPRRGLAPAVKALAVVNPGRAVTVSVPPAERGRVSLDYTYIQPRAQTAGGSLFRVSDGASAVTFKPCPPTIWPGGRTQFAGGFIVQGAQCAEVDIQVAGSRTRMRRYIPFGTPPPNEQSNAHPNRLAGLTKPW